MKCETCYSREDCTENEKDYCISRDYVEYEYYDDWDNYEDNFWDDERCEDCFGDDYYEEDYYD